jgi:hypothetical protein
MNRAWTLWVLSILAILWCIPAPADNVLLVDQVGDNLNFNVTQSGSNNVVKSLGLNSAGSLNGAYETIDLDMIGKNNSIGIWTSGYDKDTIGYISGNSNQLFLDNHGNYGYISATITGDNNYAWLEHGNTDSNQNNTITLLQSGDSHYAYLEAFSGSSNDIDVYQGNGQDDNHAYVMVTSGGDSNDIKVWQGKHADGSTDTDETGGHEVYWTVSGDSNTLSSYQTDTNRGGGGGSAHHIANYITGNNNFVEHTQMGKAGHDGFVEINGNSNTVDLYQRGNGGVKWADVVLDGDGHTVDVDQRGSNSATAAIDLTYGTGAYDFTLTQNVTSAAGSYSVTGICYNASGCTITVNGNN